MRSLTRSAWVRSLAAPGDPVPVGYARFVIGVAALLRAQEGYAILTDVLRPGSLRLPYVPLLPDLAPTVLPFLVGLWAVCAACFAVGFRTRICGATLTLTMGYVLLLDQQTYSNHLYLLVLATGLLTAGNAGAAFSVDATRQKAAPQTVPSWLPLLLRYQLSTVYFWGALAKLTIPFLTGDIVREHTNPAITDFLQRTGYTDALFSALAFGVVGAELALSIILWLPQWRYAAFALGTALHVGMVILFWDSPAATQIQIFAVLSLGLYLPTIFAARREG